MSMDLTPPDILKKIEGLDTKRNIAILKNEEETIDFCVEHFIYLAKKAIADHGNFFVALSGGSTPKAIFQELANPLHRDKLDWTKVHLFWSDERSVPPNDLQSNFKMAMDAGFSTLPIPIDHIHRMKAEGDITAEAKQYEMLIIQKVPNQSFDMVMLGIGEDGHTASLFPKTAGLHSEDELVIANFVPKLDTWRMSLTFKCINQAKNIVVYAIGRGKADILWSIFHAKYEPDVFPAQGVGIQFTNKSLWIMDKAAAYRVVHSA